MENFLITGHTNKPHSRTDQARNYSIQGLLEGLRKLEKYGYEHRTVNQLNLSTRKATTRIKLKGNAMETSESQAPDTWQKEGTLLLLSWGYVDPEKDLFLVFLLKGNFVYMT